VVLVVADHNVVEDGNLKEIAGFFKPPGDHAVFGRGCGVSTGVVNEDHRGGGSENEKGVPERNGH
jgi:hypothetical protein